MIGRPVAARAWKIAWRATGLIAGPGQPSPAASEQRPQPVAVDRDPPHRVDEDEAVGAALGGGRRDRGDVRDARAELGQHGHVGLGAAALDKRPRLAGVGADRDATRLDVRAGHVQLDRGDRGVAADAGDGGRVLRRRPAADARDHGDAELAETGQVVGAERVEAGIREPDRVHHSRGRLGDPHRRVALARVQGDRLRHERPQAERSGRERVERARAVHERVWERDAAERRRAGQARTRAASTTGPSMQSRFQVPSMRTAQP